MTLHISNLSKRYGNNWVLRDIHLDVEPGSVLAILGAARSGKSTLLKILAGRERANSSNSLQLEGRTVVYPEFNDSTTNFWPFGKTSNRARLSRESFSKAIGASTDVLLIDDPLQAMDHLSREELLREVRTAVVDRQLTVVYATSDFETAALVSDRIAVIDAGYVQQVGTVEELYESPLSIPVARLTGRCNIFSARRLTSTKFEIPEFQTIDGDHRLFTERADIAKLGAINKNASLAIRPENISMSFGASFPEDNLIKGVVTGTKYLGPLTLVELDASGLKLTAQVLRLVGLGIGQECMLGLPPDRIKVLKD